MNKSILLKEIIREELAKKLKEKGMRSEIEQECDLVMKSGNVKTGAVFILLENENIDGIIDKIKDSPIQVYILIEKNREKDLVSQSISKGLAGKIKFISWEIKFYGV